MQEQNMVFFQLNFLIELSWGKFRIEGNPLYCAKFPLWSTRGLKLENKRSCLFEAQDVSKSQKQ